MTRLADATWPDLDGARDRIFAVPVGSTEQHGPHLPLTTDTDIAAALVKALAAHRHDVLIAPPIAYGASGEHQAFPGTLSIGHEALELLLVELGRSATETVDRVLFVNGHGGNQSAIERATHRLQAEGRDVRAFTPSLPGDAHAGHVETSLLLLMNPDRVQMNRARAGNTTPLSELMPRLLRGGMRKVAPNGVLGDPSAATAEEGRHLLDDVVAALANATEAWWPSRPAPNDDATACSRLPRRSKLKACSARRR